MSCERVQEKLGSYLLGEVDEDERAEVERHVKHCAACQGEMESLSGAIHAIYAGADRPAARDREAVRPQPAPAPHLRWRRYLVPLAAMALFSVTLAAGVRIWRDHVLAKRPFFYELFGPAPAEAPSKFAAESSTSSAALAAYEDKLRSAGTAGQSVALADEVLVVARDDLDEERKSAGLEKSGYAGGNERAARALRQLGYTAAAAEPPKSPPARQPAKFRAARARLDGPARGEEPAPSKPVRTEQAPSEPAAPTQGALRARDAEGKTIAELPLAHTDVRAEVTGYLASTQVRQRFHNSTESAIEAVYVFPLPSGAAVHDFAMQVGERRIIGLIRPRAEAERLYREARARGQTASLLTQERTNIFTQNVANIAPAEDVEITIAYSETLPYEDGRYEYVFPMVVGPRYIPGSAVSPQPAPSPGATVDPGGGTSPDTDQVPDASRITPPVLAAGERSGHDVSLEVSIDAGVPVTSTESPTHPISVEPTGVDRSLVRLAERDAIANRDFVLRWRVAGDATRLGLLAHRDAQHGGFFTLMMVPPLDPQESEVMPREVTFVVDTSGSMSGVPIKMCKELVQRTLLSLRPDDRFNIVTFSGRSAHLSEQMLANTKENVARGLAFLERFRGDGGTEMLRGIEDYLALPADPFYLRVVCFLTDGYVGNEDRILATIRERGQGARWFAFGIGSSINRMLIEGIGKLGHGASMVVLPRDEAAGEKAVKRFFAMIDAPVLVDVKLDFGTLPVTDVFPAQVNDLFTGEPLTLVGRYRVGASGTITVSGRTGSRWRDFTLPVTLPDAASQHEVLGAVWARRKIGELSEALLGKPGDATLIQAITQLALEFRLTSAYTAFVAVDQSRVVGDGKPLRILQPVELPEHVSREATEREVNGAVRVPAWGLTLAPNAAGEITVTAVDDGARAAVGAGDVLVSVERTQVRGLLHLESLLLQCAGPSVVIGFRSAGALTLPLP
jgi:Ca-activated chloride channel family protein